MHKTGATRYQKFQKAEKAKTKLKGKKDKELPKGTNVTKTNFKVRQEALKVLHLILSNVSAEKVEPFFDIMSTYLRSSMTHIDARIQEDSLLFLDILLLCAPLRIAQDFHRIIPNFLDMISKLRVDSKPDRTLTVNLNNQNTSAKWRVKVFQRLQEFLQKYAAYKNIESSDKNKSSNITIFDSNEFNRYSLFDPINTANCTVSCFSGKNSDIEYQIDEIEKFNEYTETLIPLLFETWFEACPSSKSDGSFETVISEETGQLLKHILQTLTLLKKLLKYYNTKCPSSHIEKLLFQKYKSSFSQHFMSSFPYVTNVRSRPTQVTASGMDSTDPKLIAENLELCQLFIAFNPHVNLKNQSREIGVVLGYIEKIFNQNNDSRINGIIISILNMLFSYEITGWTRTITVLDALFRKIIWTYFNKSMSDTLKHDLFALLCKITLNEKLSHFHSNDAFDMWLASLPDILLSEKLTIQTVNILHQFAVTRNGIFNSILKPKLLAIITNLPKLVISDSDGDPGCYYRLLSILYWIRVWDTDSLNLLENQLMENAYKQDHIKYIFDTLRLKSGGIL
ncbi:testis-expressed protein 10 isoform X2 [Bicyclus anynana]|uniref:Testis-expressed protein 10 isoform X2 n=1 Tax=Bicyclus anynana TaxID=110368 RepID=A0ABM3LPY2_BICAN|nr:testis-expressed protein 10 isoform X2 [Bicyclus anynana]